MDTTNSIKSNKKNNYLERIRVLARQTCLFDDRLLNELIESVDWDAIVKRYERRKKSNHEDVVKNTIINSIRPHIDNSGSSNNNDDWWLNRRETRKKNDNIPFIEYTIDYTDFGLYVKDVIACSHYTDNKQIRQDPIVCQLKKFQNIFEFTNSLNGSTTRVYGTSFISTENVSLSSVEKCIKMNTSLAQMPINTDHVKGYFMITENSFKIIKFFIVQCPVEFYPDDKINITIKNTNITNYYQERRTSQLDSGSVEFVSLYRVNIVIQTTDGDGDRVTSNTIDSIITEIISCIDLAWNDGEMGKFTCPLFVDMKMMAYNRFTNREITRYGYLNSLLYELRNGRWDMVDSLRTSDIFKLIKMKNCTKCILVYKPVLSDLSRPESDRLTINFFTPYDVFYLLNANGRRLKFTTGDDADDDGDSDDNDERILILVKTARNTFLTPINIGDRGRDTATKTYKTLNVLTRGSAETIALETDFNYRDSMSIRLFRNNTRPFDRIIGDGSIMVFVSKPAKNVINIKLMSGSTSPRQMVSLFFPYAVAVLDQNKMIEPVKDKSDVRNSTTVDQNNCYKLIRGGDFFKTNKFITGVKNMRIVGETSEGRTTLTKYIFTDYVKPATVSTITRNDSGVECVCYTVSQDYDTNGVDTFHREFFRDVYLLTFKNYDTRMIFNSIYMESKRLVDGTLVDMLKK